MQSNTHQQLSERWRNQYLAAVALISSDQPYSDPVDPATRARAQRTRTDLRRWIDAQKRLATAGQLPTLQAFFINRIPDDWREIDLRRQRATRLARLHPAGLDPDD